MKRILIAFSSFAAAAGASAATLTYTPQGSAPYLWSDTAAWGGAVPTDDDSATVSQTTLKSNPLFVTPGDNAVSSNLVIGNGTLYVEPNASLTVKKGEAGGITIAKDDGTTVGVVTNYGTITLWHDNGVQFRLRKLDEGDSCPIRQLRRPDRREGVASSA